MPPNPPTEVGILLPLLEILNGVWEILPVALRDETAGDDADHAKAGKDAVHNAEVVLTLLWFWKKYQEDHDDIFLNARKLRRSLNLR